MKDNLFLLKRDWLRVLFLLCFCVSPFSSGAPYLAEAGQKVSPKAFIKDNYLYSLTLNPTTVVGGNSVQGTVTLNRPAPSTGARVFLSSSDISVAVAPAKVTVPGGALQADFVVATNGGLVSSVTVIISGYYVAERSAQLRVDPAQPAPVTLSGLALNPASVVGGSSSQGTVTLSGAAPSGGAVVTLSDNSSAVTPPASVTVPAGASSGAFTVATSSVSATTSATVSGSYGGANASGTLTVVHASPPPPPPAVTLSALTLSPTTVTGGGSSQGTVTLSGAAPSGGAVVTLSDKSSAVTTPTTATIPAGSSSTTFTVTTSSVSATTLTTVSGTYGGTSRSATLTIVHNSSPPPPITLLSLALNPTTVTGGSSSQGTVTLSGAAPSGGAVVTLSDNSSAVTTPTTATVPAGSSSTTFTVTTSSVSATTTATVSGTYGGTNASATLTVASPTPITLSSLALNPTTVTGGSSSQGTVTLDGAALTGGALVLLSSGNTSVATVPGSVTVSGGATSATFAVTTNAVSSSTSVSISGSYGGSTKSATLSVPAVPPPPPPITGMVWYAAPDGTPQGGGSVNNPWDLQTALNKPNTVIKPGDTLYLRGGTYQGKFVGKLKGTPASPITVRSYPGEWARIDICLQGRLAASINATTSTIPVTDIRGFRPSSFIRIGSEAIWVQEVDYPNQTLTVGRNYYGDFGNGYPHAAGARILFVRNIGDQNLTAGLSIIGANTIYRDLEVFASDMTRTNNFINAQDDPDSIGGAIAIEPGAAIVGNKIVNVIMHDAAGGSGGPGSLGAEVYGSIIYNNGWVDPNRSNGHGFYMHNPTPDLFTITDNIVFNNFGYGVHGFAQDEQGFADNIWMEGNISFNNGSPGNYPGNVANQPLNLRFPDLWVGADPNQPKNITYKNNYLYQPPGAFGGGASYGFGPALGDNVRFEGNYLVGGFGVGPTRNATATGNTILSFSPGAGGLLSIPIPAGSTYTWNSNSYFAVNAVISGCFGGNKAVPFHVNIGPAPCNRTSSGGGFMDFNDWKVATGFDVNGFYSTSLPSANAIFIRKNLYEQGRANIAVYNWQNKPTETISAARVASETGLVAGQQFEIRNVQNFLGAPVASGVYGGGSLTLPLTGPEALAVAAPINNPGGFAPASTCPQFCVFVLLPITANSSIPSSVVSASASGPGANFKNALAIVSSTLGRQPATLPRAGWTTLTPTGYGFTPASTRLELKGFALIQR